LPMLPSYYSPTTSRLQHLLRKVEVVAVVPQQQTGEENETRTKIIGGEDAHGLPIRWLQHRNLNAAVAANIIKI
jgi:hypothetical protein